MSKWLKVIGIGDGGIESLLPKYVEQIYSADVLVGGERQLTFIPQFSGKKIVLKSPLSRVVDELRDEHQEQQVVVLASGDPLFYGIGSYLAKIVGPEFVEVTPYVSSLQLAFAKCCESWQNAVLVSLHGRSIVGLAQKIHGADKVGLLTDDINTPSAIAKYLLRFRFAEYSAFIAENLGGERERTGWYSLFELIDRDFSPLTVVVLKRDPTIDVKQYGLGIADEAFAQRKPDRGMVTKREIRVLSLSELQLKPDSVLWDIGACTGSISIEAILHTPGLRVFAIEKNEEDFNHLLENQVRFRCDYQAVRGRAPAKLDDFADPDAIFIGGSGGELVNLLQVCTKRLRHHGRIVVNAATIETLYLAQQTLQSNGFHVSVTLAQTARSKPILNLTRFEGMNPIYLVTALRLEEGHGEKNDS